MAKRKSEREDAEIARILEYDEYMKSTEYPARDAVYNWIVAKHRDKGKPWTTKGAFSDKTFWSAAIYNLWDWIPTLMFIYVTYFMADWIYQNKGAYGAVLFVAVMFLFRINTLIRLQRHTNELLKKRI